MKRMPRKCFESIKPKCNECDNKSRCEYVRFMVVNDVEGNV